MLQTKPTHIIINNNLVKFLATTAELKFYERKLLLAILLFYVAIQMWVDVKINKLTIATTESVQTQLFAVSLGDSLEFNESFIINNDNKQQLATAASPSTSVGIISGKEPVRQPIIQQIVSTQQRQQFI